MRGVGDFSFRCSLACMPLNVRVSDRDHPPAPLDLYPHEPAGSGSLGRRVRRGIEGAPLVKKGSRLR